MNFPKNCIFRKSYFHHSEPRHGLVAKQGAASLAVLLHPPATLVGKFRYSRDWWPVPHIVVVGAWGPTLSSSKSCTLSEHLTPESINLGGDLAAHIKSSLY